jgi:hemoglobin-like flavoprotein
LPYDVIYYAPKPENRDQSGCVKSHNEVAKEFNRQLQERVSQLRAQLPDAILTYVDIFSAKYSLISQAKKLGKLQIRSSSVAFRYEYMNNRILR